jgi:hypothetical protein
MTQMYLVFGCTNNSPQVYKEGGLSHFQNHQSSYSYNYKSEIPTYSSLTTKIAGVNQEHRLKCDFKLRLISKEHPTSYTNKIPILNTLQQSRNIDSL